MVPREVLEIPDDILEDCNSMCITKICVSSFRVPRFGLQEEVVEKPNEEEPNYPEPPKDYYYPNSKE